MKPDPRSIRAATALLLVLLAALVVAPAARAADTWRLEREEWYVLEMGGGPAGWLRQATERDDAGRYRTVNATRLRVGRGATTLEITMESAFVETEAGEPVAIRSIVRQSQQSVESEWIFEDEQVRAITLQGGRTLETELPLPEGVWLPPAAAQRYWLERAEAGAERIEFRTISPDNGIEPVHVVQTRLREEMATVGDRTIPVTVWSVETSTLPGVTATSRYSADGWMIDERAPIPGLGDVRTHLATEAEARKAAGGAAPELMVRTFVEVEPPIERARSTVRAVYRIRMDAGKLPALPSAGAQRVEVDEDGVAATVRVDVRDPSAATEAEIADPAWLAPSTMVDGTDELIVKLARRAAREAGEDPAARAEALRAFAHRFITGKNLDSAFATASEVARTRQGDCSEHGVLLCALLRAEGIPGRVATGLVYADAFAGERDIFGWHMWTQALIDGRWIDLDATIPGPYDAAHLLVGTSALAEGGGIGELAAVVSMMGNLSVEVVELEHR